MEEFEIKINKDFDYLKLQRTLTGETYCSKECRDKKEDKMTTDEKFAKCLTLLTELARECDPKWAYTPASERGYALPIETEATLGDIYNDGRKSGLNWVGCDVKKFLEGLG